MIERDGWWAQRASEGHPYTIGKRERKAVSLLFFTGFGNLQTVMKRVTGLASRSGIVIILTLESVRSGSQAT
ncbi:MAG: hypothetical protein JO011_17845 [Ktedonobacteraceae bacterium]|nr:hypothetical protein [Ktedonobacteraceae bacterium]